MQSWEISDLIIVLYKRKNVSNLKWALLILKNAIEIALVNGGGERSEILEVRTRHAEEAASKLGMARGTGRAALSMLKDEGIVSRVGRGRWIVKASIVRASWPGEALMLLAGREEGELVDARGSFLRASIRGWDEGERDRVSQVAQASFRDLWKVLKKGGGRVFLIYFEDTGLRRDRQGMIKLAKYLARIGRASILVRVKPAD